MAISNNILNELKELSPLLAGIEKTNVFTVPQGYFDSLNETVLACINEEEISPINKFSKAAFFEVPQGYFDGLSANILNKIKEQQNIALPDEAEDGLSPMLQSIQQKNVFEVPAGYFDTVATVILSKVKPQAAKVVIMHKRTNFFKYAAAAIITGIMALGVYKFIAHTNNSTTGLASLDPTIQQGIKMNDTQFNQALNSLSDDAISSYLEKNVTDGDIAAISSDIDDNDLPSQDDYLLDGKTLDNYLNDNGTKEKTN